MIAAIVVAIVSILATVLVLSMCQVAADADRAMEGREDE